MTETIDNEGISPAAARSWKPASLWAVSTIALLILFAMGALWSCDAEPPQPPLPAPPDAGTAADMAQPAPDLMPLAPMCWSCSQIDWLACDGTPSLCACPAGKPCCCQGSRP